MPLEPYDPCPCGCGKKVKFCAPKEAVADLQKVQRAIEGEQWLAAQELARELSDRFPQASLPAFFCAQLAFHNRDGQVADLATERFHSAAPENPYASAFAAITAASKNDPEKTQEALRLLQDAIDRSPGWDSVTGPVLMALEIVAVQSLRDRPTAGAALLRTLIESVDDRHGRRYSEILAMLHAQDRIPPVFRHAPGIPSTAPPDMPADSFEEARNLVRWSAFREAGRRLEQLASRFPARYEIYHSLATVQVLMGENAAAAQTWRSCMLCDGIDEQDRTFAEALAQEFDPEAVEFQEVLMRTYEVPDFERLMETLLSNRCFMRREVMFDGAPGEVRPRAQFVVTSNPVASTFDDIDETKPSEVVGLLTAFGRETDREARIEVILGPNIPVEQLNRCVAQELAGLVTIPCADETTRTEMRRPFGVIGVIWVHPLDDSDESTAKKLQQLEARYRRQYWTERWLDQPRRALADKSPREAAQDANLKLEVNALLDRYAANTRLSEIDVAASELREALGLSSSEEAVVDAAKCGSLPLYRIAEVPVEELPETDLTNAFYRSMLHQIEDMMLLFGRELYRRELDDEELPLRDTCSILAELCDGQEAIEFSRRAAELARKAGQSPVGAMIQEFHLHLGAGDQAEAEKIVETIYKEHSEEPVAQEFLQSLSAAIQAANQEFPDSPTEAAPEEPESKIWTPDSPSQEAAPKSGSRLWVPGSD